MTRHLRFSLLALVALTAPNAHAQGVWETVVAANWSGDNLSVFRKNPATGALAPLGTPVTTGRDPADVTVHPNNRFLYVSNSLDGSISAFDIDGVTGNLTAIAGSPFSEGGDPHGMTMDPEGRFLYVADPLFEKIKGFHINRSTGALTPFASSFPVANNVGAVAIEPAGRFLYATTSQEDDGASRIWGFAVAPTGALSPLAGSPWLVGMSKNTFSVLVLPWGRFLYAVNYAANEVVGYAIDGLTGALASVPGSPFATGAGPWGLAAMPDGGVLYVSNGNGASVSAYSVNRTTGTLSPVAGSPFPAGPGPRGMQMDPSGRLLYLASSVGNQVNGYSVDPSTGVLSELAGSPYPAGAYPGAMGGTRFGDIIFADGFESSRFAGDEAEPLPAGW